MRTFIMAALLSTGLIGCGPADETDANMNTTEQEVLYPCSYEDPYCPNNLRCNYEMGVCEECI